MTDNPAHREEHVMVVPTETLYSKGFFQGLHFDTEAHMQIINDLKNVKFLKRADVETDPSYKQIIPYAILVHDNFVFSYLRGKLLNEKRLQGNYSIGVGGHISADDVNLFAEAYMKGMYREINEEIAIETKFSQRVVALLNDDSNEVGKVHFGIVHLFTLQEPLVRTKEKSMNQGRFVERADLSKNIDKYENWSRICIDQLDRLMEKC